MVVIINKKIAGFVIIAIILSLIVGFILLKGTKAKTVGSYDNDNNILKPIDKGNENSRYIAFTCNVDWGNEILPDMLDILNKEKVKITFFITGRWANEFPDLMQQIVDNGHEIGSHCYQHLNYETLTLEQNKEQIKKRTKYFQNILKGELLYLLHHPVLILIIH